MFQRLNNMFVGEINNLSSQEPEFSEKEDDEWILVDFIGGLTTIKVETSPMENLLIEHPSMSVYAVHNTCHSLNETSCGDEEFHNPSSPREDSNLSGIMGFHALSSGLVVLVPVRDGVMTSWTTALTQYDHSYEQDIQKGEDEKVIKRHQYEIKEIYAPKLQEFAYVTDGACSEDDIIRMELIVLKALKWELCPVTIISWLNLYLQVDALKDVPKVLLPQYSQEKFIQIAQLLDLCILDVSSLDFQYRTLAAAALCHYSSAEVVKKASGLDWDSISECVEWMVPFVRVARKAAVKLKSFKKVAVEDRHNIQTHTNYLDMLCLKCGFIVYFSEELT
ncbi:G1/S-specific cyclin-E2 [Chelonia mydas]|uniref:G1/S-specific cyclin-E2 n=1 Tax=Chelonia mydas TaxID=8469 RepID=M7AUF5_CHEMY|nr:G1/S-specific cyclin-E2 [Chelonia mydas]